MNEGLGAAQGSSLHDSMFEKVLQRDRGFFFPNLKLRRIWELEARAKTGGAPVWSNRPRTVRYFGPLAALQQAVREDKPNRLTWWFPVSELRQVSIAGLAHSLHGLQL
ncbi:hypothetical protein PIB30_006682 [Stylosanthes scabra]|uniref:Uncharacterized protein n=1 Tax=Stylosanthes scabra TaxID=79078 RepID=A0ABU6R3B6_9FABA|nr:hypothetical protein [Stylosanthes scabra]